MSGQAIIGALRAVFGADTAAFEDGIDRVHKEMKRTERSFKKFGDKLQNIGKTMSVGVTAPITAMGVASIKTASDMAELESAFDVTFGGASESVRKWAQETGDALGRSTKEVQESAVAFQSLFSKALDPQKAIELTKEFSVLTQDLASFKNLSNEVAQQKLFSGLTGEAEPLRAVGVFINEAAVTAKALEIGLEKVNGKFTDQQKIVARAALIQDQLVQANGDVVRTFDSTENQLKRAGAAFEELRVVIGTQLLPVVTPLIVKIADALTWFTKLPQPVINASLAIAGIAAAVGPVLVAIGTMITTFAPFLAGLVAATGATTAFGAAMTVALGPIGLIVAAIGLLALAYEGAGEAARNAEKAASAANSKIESYIGTQKDLAADTDLLKLKTKELNEAIGESGSASQDAARLEIDAIRQRIEKNKELQRIYLDDAKIQLMKTEEANEKANNKQLAWLAKISDNRSHVYNKLRYDDGTYKAAIEDRFRAELEGLRQVVDGGEILSGKQRKRFEKLNSYFLESGTRAQALLDIETKIAELSKEGATYKKPKAAPLVDMRAPVAAPEPKKKKKASTKKSDVQISKDAAAAARENVKQTLLLADALSQSQEEYDITAAGLNLVKSGYMGTAAEVRALAIETIEADKVLSQAQETRRAQIEAEAEAQRVLTEAAREKREEAERIAEAHSISIENIKQEIENNRILTEAMKISTREYQIQAEVIRMLEAGNIGTKDSARQLAEELIASRDGLEKVTASTKETEDALKKTGKTGVDAFTATANSFTGLLKSLESGDIEGILTGIMGVLDSIFGISGSGKSSGGGILDAISGIAGVFGGGRAVGGPVQAGVTYLVGERGPELFTPPGNGQIIPNNKMGGGMVTLKVNPSPYFDAHVDDRAAGVASPIANASTYEGVSKYSAANTRRGRQRLK